MTDNKNKNIKNKIKQNKKQVRLKRLEAQLKANILKRKKVQLKNG
tara:strand:+ start:396 stop:530 length:135 start_codon:yes stop_codon:yes gene_type:complete